jgi:hypothetical protein
LTLFVIPALYVLLAPLTRSGDPVEARFDRQMADHESRRVGVNGAHAGFNGSGGHGASRPRVPTLPRAEA